jgi:hypothetical protein
VKLLYKIQVLKMVRSKYLENVVRYLVEPAVPLEPTVGILLLDPTALFPHLEPVITRVATTYIGQLGQKIVLHRQKYFVLLGQKNVLRRHFFCSTQTKTFNNFRTESFQVFKTKVVY